MMVLVQGEREKEAKIPNAWFTVHFSKNVDVEKKRKKTEKNIARWIGSDVAGREKTTRTKKQNQQQIIGAGRHNVSVTYYNLEQAVRVDSNPVYLRVGNVCCFYLLLCFLVVGLALLTDRDVIDVALT